MDPLTIGQLVGSVGFPAAMCIWFAWYVSKQWAALVERVESCMRAHTEAVHELRETVRLLAHELGAINAFNNGTRQQ